MKAFKYSVDAISWERGFILLYHLNLFAEKCETSEITVHKGNFISLQSLFTCILYYRLVPFDDRPETKPNQSFISSTGLSFLQMKS